MSTPVLHKTGFRAWLPIIALAFAAFVFNSLPDIGELNSMTLNLNGMVSRRFEGYEEYLKIREFDIKTGDLITVEIEFDSSEPFKLDGLAILFLKKKS